MEGEGREWEALTDTEMHRKRSGMTPVDAETSICARIDLEDEVDKAVVKEK